MYDLTRRSPLLTLLLLTAPIVAAGCGGGGGGGRSPTAPTSPGGSQVVTVEVVDNAFEPRQIQIAPGTTVRWVMRGTNAGHTATALNGSFDSGFVFNNSGAAFEHTFTSSDDNMTFEYFCRTHSDCCDMKGSVRVGQNAPPPNTGY